MPDLGLKERLASFLRKILLSGDSGETEALRKEIETLKSDLRALELSGRTGVKREIENLRTDLEGAGEKDLSVMKLELDLMRNEMQENIAAIHRLEILTLNRRLEFLNAFGKTLPPTRQCGTGVSTKPQGFSFGIITNGKRNEKLYKLVETIRQQKLAPENYEILVAGCVAQVNGCGEIRTFPMEDAAGQGRLGAMRNVLARNARFNKFVCLDDDFLLHPRWAEAVEEVQDDFDLANGIILNPDLSRYCDWVNIIENYTFLRSYTETFDTCQYVTGGYGIYKDYILAEHSWNDELGFYQGEDVSFSRKLFNAGYKLKFIPRAVVMHDDERYRQKGYGVVRLKSAEQIEDDPIRTLRLEKLCPRTLS